MAADPAGSVRRASGVLGIAILLSNAGQIAWLAVGRHAFGPGHFGAALAAQSLYGLLQMVLDNGASWDGARHAAAGTLTVGRRAALIRARTLLAAASVVVTLIVGLIGDERMLIASAPFMAALLLFALLNVWEPLGQGRMGPYATLVGGRSLALAAVVLGATLLGWHLPLVIPGCVECAVILLAAMVARQPRPRLVSGERAPWATIFRVGTPAVVLQYNLAIGTVLLGVTGRLLAAATMGVTARLVSGLGSIQGAAATALFPRLARTPNWRRTDANLAGAGVALTVLVAVLGLAATMVAGGLIAAGFLGHHDGPTRAALMLGVSGAAGAGITVQLVLLLIALRLERTVLPALVAGAAVVTAGAIIGTLLAGTDGATVVAAAFAAGQALTAVMLALVCSGRTQIPGWALRLAALSSCLLAAVAGVASLAPGTRVPLAAALVLAAPSWFAASRRRLRRRSVVGPRSPAHAESRSPHDERLRPLRSRRRPETRPSPARGTAR
jgi:O-antigen/teichoic acid export membrane protein